MINIALHHAEFFAYHGFYPEEQIWGNRFLIDIEAGYNSISQNVNDELSQTINYEKLYQIAENRMSFKSKLLETVAQDIQDEIKLQFPYVETLKVTVRKLNPPLGGPVAYSAVTVTL